MNVGDDETVAAVAPVLGSEGEDDGEAPADELEAPDGDSSEGATPDGESGNGFVDDPASEGGDS